MVHVFSMSSSQRASGLKATWLYGCKNCRTTFALDVDLVVTMRGDVPDDWSTTVQEGSDAVRCGGITVSPIFTAKSGQKSSDEPRIEEVELKSL